MSFSVEQDTQETVRPDQGKRSDSPEPSCVSMKSEGSMGRDRDLTVCSQESVIPEGEQITSRMSFSVEQDTQETVRPDQGKRSDSPEPSCVSMKSEGSMGRDRDLTVCSQESVIPEGEQITSRMSFSVEQDTQETVRPDQGKRSDSPEPSCVSMKSEGSMGRPLFFRDDNRPTEFRQWGQVERRRGLPFEVYPVVRARPETGGREITLWRICGGYSVLAALKITLCPENMDLTDMLQTTQ
ncbi:hypothetical protein NFI96_023848 [Prochilodus magdalenae]|nr:hypothetical protein NFI96_023848 [Prochilodus magdalenae]